MCGLLFKDRGRRTLTAEDERTPGFDTGRLGQGNPELSVGYFEFELLINI